MSNRLQELRELRGNPNVQRFLNMLSAAEGTQKHGYATAFGGKRLASLSDHPNVSASFTQTNGKTNSTTAAGRYQFLNSTWKELQGKLGLKDFGAESQDLAAIQLLKDNGALKHILSGDMRKAVQLSGRTWASLPSANYKQRRKSWDFVNQHLGVPLSISRPAEGQDVPTAPPSLSPLMSAIQQLSGAQPNVQPPLQLQEMPQSAQPSQTTAVNSPAGVTLDALLTDTPNQYSSLSDALKAVGTLAQASEPQPAVQYSDPQWLDSLSRSLESAAYSREQEETLQNMFGSAAQTAFPLGEMPEGVNSYLTKLINNA